MKKFCLRHGKNGNDAFLVWKIDQPTGNCRSFVNDQRRNGGEEALLSKADFASKKWKRGELRPSTVWPIQKFMCSDVRRAA